MELKPKTAAALDHWLGIETWHKPHDDDMDRWFDFVNQYQIDHGFTVNEPELQKHIGRKVGVKFGEDDGDENSLQGIIRKRVSLAVNILDFLYRTDRVPAPARMQKAGRH